VKNFRDKVAAITGAGSGIGQALAWALAKEGAHLALSDINAENLERTADEARRIAGDSTGQRTITTRVVDVAQRSAVEEWAAKVREDHGGCNLIFNNAGVALAATVEGSTYEELEWIVGINFWGVVYGTKSFLPLLKESGDGHVINISSLFGLVGVPGQCGYNATKFAVRGFTESLRQELDLQNQRGAGKVSATCVHPGGIATNISRAARSNDSLKTIGLDPVTTAEKFEKLLVMPPKDAADIILRAVKKNERRVLVGRDAKLGELVQRFAPSAYQRIFRVASQRFNR
jgi:NAD(P)-dependent dehydrogenase (short-subunit alcohol dehydrogenase family)